MNERQALVSIKRMIEGACASMISKPFGINSIRRSSSRTMRLFLSSANRRRNRKPDRRRSLN